MRLQTFSSIVVLLSFLLAVPSANARTDAEIEEDIRLVLGQRHPKDNAAWWRALGPTAPRVIIRMAENSSHVYHRVRLVQALGWFDDPMAVEFLKRQAERAEDDVVRNAAVNAVGVSQGVKEEEFLAKFLKHPDPQTRLTAAQALKRLNDPRAGAIVEKYLAEEKASWVVAKLKNQPPVLPSKLLPVASSEDRPDSGWEGRWKGLWLTPAALPAHGMDQLSAALELKVEGAGISGELVLYSSGKAALPPRTYLISKTGGKAARFSGVLRLKTPPAEEGASERAGFPAKESSFEAELIRSGARVLLELRVPEQGGFLVLRRESAS